MIIALRKIRESKEIDAPVLGEMVGVSKHTIWSWERGDSQPDPEMLCKLSDALGVSIDMIIRGKEKDRHEGRSMEELLQMYKSLSDEQLDYLTALMQAIKADRQFQAHIRQVEKEGQ